MRLEKGWGEGQRLAVGAELQYVFKGDMSGF